MCGHTYIAFLHDPSSWSGAPPAVSASRVGVPLRADTVQPSEGCCKEADLADGRGGGQSNRQEGSAASNRWRRADTC